MLECKPSKIAHLKSQHKKQNMHLGMYATNDFVMRTTNVLTKKIALLKCLAQKTEERENLIVSKLQLVQFFLKPN